MADDAQAADAAANADADAHADEDVLAARHGVVVVRVTDSLERALVVKRPASDADDDALGRLVTEATVRAALVHPNVLPLFALHEGLHLVGPFIPGPTLADLPATPLDPADALAVVDGLASALDGLHRQGWCHGDVSGGNVLLADAGPGRPPHPVLIDFEHARRLDEPPPPAGGATPRCSAPELLAGHGATRASDLYGLGVIAYRLLTGRWPVDTDDVQEAQRLHASGRWPRPSLLAGGLPPEADDVLAAAMAVDPAARFSTGLALVRALRRAGLATVSAGAHAPTTGAAQLGDADALAAHIAAVAERLPESDDAAFHRLLGLAHQSLSEAVEHVAGHTGQLLGPAAALAAVERIGAMAAMADGDHRVADLAAAIGAVPDRLAVLLDVLRAAGVVVAEDDGRVRLAPPYAAVAAARAVVGGPSTVVAENAAFWGSCAAWALGQTDTGTGAGAHGYEETAAVLGALFDEPARVLAEKVPVRSGAVVLDIGAGSAVWGRALAADADAALVVALDRPGVVAHAVNGAVVAGLGGDAAALPAAAGSVDVAVLANVVHLMGEADAARAVFEAARVVRADGLVIVVDSIPDDIGADLGAALQSLQLGLRFGPARVHGAASYRRWAADAGLHIRQVVELGGRLRALVTARGPAREACR